MNSHITNGLICLRDDLGIEYVVSKIRYTIWENEEYEYCFEPNYSVIGLLPITLFQGIPGLNLELHKTQYIRKNTTPVFITERTPGRNRENLTELLDEYGMKYLNRLEWLIKTDKKYIGDRLYVRAEDTARSETVTDFNETVFGLKRSYDVQRKLIECICGGMTVELRNLVIDDTNRKICYSLLYYLYEKEAINQKKLQHDGISIAKSNWKYHGRKPIQIDDTNLYDVYKRYKAGHITPDAAANELNISTSTFYRRIRKLNAK